jgi:RNA polymerase sigma-70 factor (ECF subfamily)
MEACVITSEEAPPRDVFLIDACRSGDLDAFEELYREHSGRVFALCLRMTADRALAEDLTQESFLRAWDKLSLFRRQGDFGAWLRRLTINVVLADRRSRGRRQARETGTDDVARFERPVRRSHPAPGLDLETALGSLPEGARTVFLLHDVEGYRHEEIARMLHVATGTSKTQLHRARKLLRKALES